MKDFKIINKITLKDVAVEDIIHILKQWEFKVLLQQEALTRDVDIMLENMLDYFVEKEEYEWCCIVRDEIKARELEPRKIKNPPID